MDGAASSLILSRDGGRTTRPVRRTGNDRE
jgi:hypothetical protein